MKRIGLWLLILFMPFVLANAQDNNYGDRHKDEPLNITVNADEDLDAEFSKYETFAFASNIEDNMQGASDFMNNPQLKNDIRDAVRAELEGLGYEKEDEAADLVVTFRVFNKETTLTGFEAPRTLSNKKVREAADKREFEVEVGTIFIQMADREQGKVVWQAFASGLMNGDQFMNDKPMIEEAVNLIFDRYDYRANEYVKR